MEALTEANVRILRRLEALEQRLRALEARHGAPAETQAPPEAAPLPAAEPPPVEQPPVPPAPEPEQHAGLETRIGLAWVNRVAVVTCMLAAAFFFKYAVDNEWVGPGGRVVIGILAGLVILGIAERLFSKGHTVYAQGLSGLGIAVLYLAFQASFAFYRLVPQALAFALMVLTTLSGAFLALRYDAPVIAALTLVGGYATPVLLSTGEDRPWFFLGYLLLLNSGVQALAALRRWRLLTTLSLAGTALMYWAWLVGRGSYAYAEPAPWRLPGWLFLLTQYFLYLPKAGEAFFFAVHLLACAALTQVWPVEPSRFLWTLAALSAAALWAADRRNWERAPLVALGAWWAAYAYWKSEYWPPAALAPNLAFTAASFLLFFCWLPWRVVARRIEARKQDLILASVNAAVMFGILYSLLSQDYSRWLGLVAALMAAMHLGLGWLLLKRQAEEKRDTRPVFLALGIAITLLTLAAPIQFSGFRITLAWAVEGAALSWIAARTRAREPALAACAIFALILGRLALFDANALCGVTEYSLMLNARFLTFAVSAASFAAAALFLREPGLLPRAAPAAVYTGAHLVLLGGLAMEVSEWTRRNFPDGGRSVESMALSFLCAAYALALVIAGVRTRSALNRALGLALIVFVMLKLYLYDIWQLRLAHRVIAFAALGALLLAMSFLYSRYRAAIEDWWRDEKN